MLILLVLSLCCGIVSLGVTTERGDATDVKTIMFVLGMIAFPVAVVMLLVLSFLFVWDTIVEMFRTIG
jgi:hypothetical protein